MRPSIASGRRITTPSELKKWFFGVDTEADWKVGGNLVHRGEYEGKPYVDKGEILAFEPPRRLVHTHWSDVSGLADVPENYQEVAWDLTERAGGTQRPSLSGTCHPMTRRRHPSRARKGALQSLRQLVEGCSPAGVSAPSPDERDTELGT